MTSPRPRAALSLAGALRLACAGGRLLILLAAVIALAADPRAQATRTTFATGLTGPRGLVQLSDGRILVSETGAGRVSNITDGTQTTFATGLTAPQSFVRLADGRILVVENTQSTGRVSLLSTTGARTTFASGLEEPVGIVQLADGRILVAEFRSFTGTTAGRVSDITSGTRTTFAAGLSGPVGLAQLADGRILVAEAFGNRVSVLSTSGVRSDFVTGLGGPEALVRLADNRILVSEGGAGRVSDITSGTRTAFATGLSGPRDVVQLADGRILVSENSASRVSLLTPPTTVTVDTNADNQTYTAALSPAECTDATAGNCTLREAIEVANATAGITTVAFNVDAANGAVGGVATITLATALPALAQAGVTIDGYTQPGAAVNTLAVGTNAVLRVALRSTATVAGYEGLTLTGSGQTVHGLSVGGFSRGIFANGTTDAVIAGNYLGLGTDGTTRVANSTGLFIGGGTGVRVGTNRTGTADAASRNVVSGNTFEGIYVNGTANAVFAGNYIGLNAAGTAAVGNGGNGILATGIASGLRIGTDGNGVADASERNVISGNTTSGIQFGNVTGAVVAGNTIGLAAAGTAAVGNGFGILTSSGTVTGLRIGTNGDGLLDDIEANRIRGNTGRGVILFQPSAQASVLGNEIAANGPTTGATGLGIDLGATGVTANDPGDPDAGPNGLQNFPVVTSASPASVAFTLNSTATTTFRVEFFASAAADPSGHGEGERFVGFTNVTTDASGNATGTLTPTGLADGEFVAATATPVTVNGTGAVTGFPAGTGTSEFSLAVQASAPSAITVL